jgi:hypothetical protein
MLVRRVQTSEPGVLVVSGPGIAIAYTVTPPTAYTSLSTARPRSNRLHWSPPCYY